MRHLITALAMPGKPPVGSKGVGSTQRDRAWATENWALVLAAAAFTLASFTLGGTIALALYIRGLN